MNLETAKACSFENWYPIFRKQTVRGVAVDMPDEFKTFLLEGEFIVEEGMWPDLEKRVDEAIEELGGRAFVKLNFTAPVDAQWIGNERSLLVRNFTDVVYLLKASTRVLIDLTKPFGEDMELEKPLIVLKKWFVYARHREFRVFVVNPNIFAITSRYCDVPCSLTRDEVRDLIEPFIRDAVNNFPHEKVIFDVYISPKLRVHIVDIQPWHETADTGMFIWGEMHGLTKSETRICTVVQIRPVEDPAVPVEFHDGKSLAELIEAFKQYEQENP